MVKYKINNKNFIIYFFINLRTPPNKMVVFFVLICNKTTVLFILITVLLRTTKAKTLSRIYLYSSANRVANISVYKTLVDRPIVVDTASVQVRTVAIFYPSAASYYRSYKSSPTRGPHPPRTYAVDSPSDAYTPVPTTPVSHHPHNRPPPVQFHSNTAAYSRQASPPARSHKTSANVATHPH